MSEYLGDLADQDQGEGGKQRRERSSRLRECGSYLVFRQYLGRDLVRLHQANFCREDKLCPLCAIRRGAKMLKEYSGRVAAVMQEAPRLVPMLVTVTVKNGSDLAERFEHLRGGLQELRFRAKEYAQRKRLSSVLSRAAGGVSSIEIKRGDGSGIWHPHAHAVWLVKPAAIAGTDGVARDACRLAQDVHSELSAEWLAVTGDSFVVDVRPFRFVLEGRPSTPDNIAPDFCEVFKYALKFSEMNLSDNLEAAEVLKGRRLISSFGSLWGVEIPEDLADEPIAEDARFVEMLFRYLDGEYVNCEVSHG